MKMNKSKQEIRQLSAEELKSQLEVLKKGLFSLRLNATTSHVKDYSQFGKIRKAIAQVATLLRQKELAEL